MRCPLHARSECIKELLLIRQCFVRISRTQQFKTSIPSCPTVRFVIRRNLKSNRGEFQIESHHCELCIAYCHSPHDALRIITACGIQSLFSFRSTKPLLFHGSICCSGLNSSNRISLNLPYTWYLGRH